MKPQRISPLTLSLPNRVVVEAAPSTPAAPCDVPAGLVVTNDGKGLRSIQPSTPSPVSQNRPLGVSELGTATFAKNPASVDEDEGEGEGMSTTTGEGVVVVVVVETVTATGCATAGCSTAACGCLPASTIGF